MVRLLVVDERSAIRRALEMWLGLVPELMVVGEAGDSLSALWQAALVHPDVILLHLESPGPDEVKLVAALRRVAQGSEVVVLSLHDDVLIRRRLLNAGAAAFVSMHDVKERLLQAIRDAARRPLGGGSAPSRGTPSAPKASEGL